jgi:hypothetical protein
MNEKGDKREPITNWKKRDDPITIYRWTIFNHVIHE